VNGFGGEIVRPFGHPTDVVFPWLLWVDAFPRWFELCRDAALLDGTAEEEGSTYRITVALGPVRKTTVMRITDLDHDLHSYRFVRAEDGNRVELDFAAEPDGPDATLVHFAASYEGSGRILGVPVGGGLFTRLIERAIDRSLPRLDRLIRAEGQ
jgi:hypothetical protein